MSRYKLLIANRNTKGYERAVLPTILFATHKESASKAYGSPVIRVSAITIGWWAWGIGIMHTINQSKEETK